VACAPNRRRSEKERTRFAARTIEARLSARAFPETAGPCTAAFAERADGIAPLLPTELQRIFEACEVLTQECRPCVPRARPTSAT
jgi:hypothetical protein